MTIKNMQIIPYYDADIESIAKDLAMGKVLVMPTETSYGLIADACNAVAVSKIYKIKSREDVKPLPLIFGSFNQVIEYVHIPSSLIEIAREYWPGAISVIAQPLDDRLKNNPVGSFGGSIAVRVTSDNYLQDLITFYKKPLTATSANISGTDNIYNFAEIKKLFLDVANHIQPDILIDKGILPFVQPSTIIADHSGQVVVLRQGDIKIN